MFWGLSESLDLYQEYINAQRKCNVEQDEPPHKSETQEARHLNILIFGGNDPRHIIHTIAKLYTHNNTVDTEGASRPFIDFYIIDGCVEAIARNILLLGIALENTESFNLRNKVHLFMDIYGNSLLRPSTHQYLVGKAKSLLKMFSDDKRLSQRAPMINVDDLKYRDRDGIQNAFNFWMPKEEHIFHMQEYWITRLRKLLGQRYDYRDGVFDWDLNMTLIDRTAKQICSQEYRYWRETGIAFTFPEYEQCKPNKTLSAGLVRNGEKYMHRGYVGDIQTGPFITFGLKSNDERMLKSMHGQNDYRATDITERNLLELFHELQTGTTYEHDLELSRKYGAVKLLMGKRLTWNECDLDAMQEYDKPWLHIEDTKLNYLSPDDVLNLQEDVKRRWYRFFDVAFVGHNYFAFIKESFTNVLRNNALLLLETKLFTLDRKDDINEFECKLMNFAKNTKLSSVINYNVMNTNKSLLRFKKNNHN